MSEFVPVSQAGLAGAVPALAGGFTAAGLVGARPRATADFVPAQSFVPWRPTPTDDARLPCAHPTKKGKVCGMARAYTVEGDPTSKLTPYCKSHWASIFAAVNAGLFATGEAWRAPLPD